MNELLERSQPSRTHHPVRARLARLSLQFRQAAKSHLMAVPYIGPRAIQGWRAMSSVSRNWALRIRRWLALRATRRSPFSEAELNATVYVCPKDIVYESMVEYRFQDAKGKVSNGDWDRLEKPFTDLDVYAAFRDVIQHHKSWTETVYYQRIASRLRGGEVLWGCSTIAELDRRCAQLDQLIHSIAADGYKSQAELADGRPDDEVTIGIGRDGDLLFSNGAHRLCIAKILNVPQIPVKIGLRHADWMGFRRQFANLAVEKGRTYQPTLHPDLQFIPVHHGCSDRLRLMGENLPIKEGKLLDLGANLGFFCSKFEEQGFTCVAVENSARYAYCLKKLRRATNKAFRIVEGSFLDSPGLLQEHYDVVLALNILHHSLKTREAFEKLEYFLAHLRCTVVYLEPHLYDEDQMLHSYRNLRPEEFADFVCRLTRLTETSLIGRASDGRSLYRIS